MSLDDYSRNLAAMPAEELYRHAVGRAGVELRKGHPFTSADWGRLTDEFAGRLQLERLDAAVEQAKAERAEVERGNEEARKRQRGG